MAETYKNTDFERKKDKKRREIKDPSNKISKKRERGKKEKERDRQADRDTMIHRQLKKTFSGLVIYFKIFTQNFLTFISFQNLRQRRTFQIFSSFTR